MNINIDLLLEDWAYRCKSGYPTKTNPLDISVLKEVLFEHGATANEILEYVELLSEKPKVAKALGKKSTKSELDSIRKQAKQLKLIGIGRGYGPKGSKHATHTAVSGKLVPIKDTKKSTGKEPEKKEPEKQFKDPGFLVGPEKEAKEKKEKASDSNDSVIDFGAKEKNNINYVLSNVTPDQKKVINDIVSKVNSILSKKTNHNQRVELIKGLISDGWISYNGKAVKKPALLLNYHKLFGPKGNTIGRAMKIMLMPSKNMLPDQKTAANAILKFAEKNNIELPVYGRKIGEKIITKQEGIIKNIIDRTSKKLNVAPDTTIATKDITGGAQGFSIGKTEFKTLPKLNTKTKSTLTETKDDIVETFVKKGMTPVEAAGQVVLVEKSITKYNKSIETLGKLFKTEKFIALRDDKGKIIDQTTPEGKLLTKRSILNTIYDSVGSYDSKLGEKIKSLAKSAEKLSPEQFEKELLDGVFTDLLNSSSARPAASSLAEMVTGLIKLNHGYQVYYPYSSDFPVADVITIKPISDLNAIKNSNELATAAQGMFSSLDLTSVKLGIGGSSAAYGKIILSEFKHPDVAEELTEITKNAHNDVWGKENVETACKVRQDQVMKLAKKYNLKIDFKSLDKRIEQTVSIQEPQYATSKKLKSLSSQDSKKYKSQIKTYMMLESLVINMHNKFIDVQNYGNNSLKAKAQSGKVVGVEAHESNGISSLCKMVSHALYKNGRPSNFAGQLSITPREEMLKIQKEL